MLSQEIVSERDIGAPDSQWVSIDAVRDQLVNAAIFAVVIFGVPAVAASVYRVTEIGWHNIMLLHIGAYLLLLVIAVLHQHLSFRLRTFGVLSILFILGAIALLTWGLVGMGVAFLITCSILATIFLGFRSGVIAMAAGLAVMTAIGTGLHLRYISFEFDIGAYALASSSWITATISAGLITAIAVASLGRLNGHLTHMVGQLSQRTAALQNVNEQLQREVTERKRAEEALRQGEARYRELVDHSRDIVWRIDSAWRFTFASPVVESMFGYPPEELQGVSFEKVLTEEGVRQARDSLARRIRGELPEEGVTIELRHRRKDGTEFVGETRSAPIWSSDGKLLELQGITRDITERKKAEAAIRESEERFRMISEQALVAISILQDGIFKYVNHAYEELSGYSFEEIRRWEPNEFAKIIHPADREFVMEQARKKQAGDEGVVPHYVYRAIVKNGKTKWVEQYSRTITHEGKSADLLMFIDITERKEAEEALRDSEERYRSLFEAANDAIFLMEGERFVDCNPRTLKLFGCTRKQIIGQPPYRFSPDRQPDGRNSKGEALKKIARAFRGEPLFFEWQHCRYDGTLFDAEVSLNRVELSGQYFVLAIVRDITERKRAESELAQARALLLAAIEQTPAGILVADAPDVRIRLANSAALDIRGKATELLTDIPVALHPANWQTYHPDGSPYEPENLPLSRAVLQGVTTKNEEVIIRRTSGEDRWVLANAAPVRNASGEIVAGVVVFPDVTEQKHAEEEKTQLREQLHQAQKMEAVGTLAAGVAHDFNNLITAIFGFTERARSLSAGKHEVLHALDGIQDAAEQGASVTKSLLTFSRKAEIEREPVHLGRLISDSVRMLRHIVPAAIEIVADISESDKLWIEGDATQLQQVMINLTVNARDAMPKGGRLRITVHDQSPEAAKTWPDVARPGRGLALLLVEDTGIGMSEEIRNRVFDPFFTTKPRGQGTGLGMAVVHGIVSDHDGGVRVTSTEGQGTRVAIAFPCCDPRAGEPEGLVDALTASGEGETIILAEDNRQVRALIATSLGAAGYNVIQAADGAEALKAFADHESEVRLAVLDLDLPKLDGLSCLEAFRKARSGLPAVVISGSPDVEPGNKQMEDVVYLPKPFQMYRLAAVVREVLGKRGAKEVQTDGGDQNPSG